MGPRLFRLPVVFAGVMGACGVILAAGAAHLPDAARLASASMMLLFHALAVLATVTLAERGIIHLKIGLTAISGFIVAAVLFAGDLTLRQYAGHSLFPMAAPIGGTLMIASWLVLAVAAMWPAPIAFSSEVDTGSRKENASKPESKARF
jgi:uncharacterized membrane protein YgdD (TMEM256/DUF423 family)